MLISTQQVYMYIYIYIYEKEEFGQRLLRVGLKDKSTCFTGNPLVTFEMSPYKSIIQKGKVMKDY